MNEYSRGWDAIPTPLQRSMTAAWQDAFGLPPLAGVLYGRWWQLESWLRSLCYVELRARYGAAWDTRIPAPAERRSVSEQKRGYMTSPDAYHRLAYVDLSRLLSMIEADWECFEGSLLPEDVWSARMIEMSSIRNRIGHCRRPHIDDLPRLEQMLRDLEPGLLRATAAYNEQHYPDRIRDPVYWAWIEQKHPNADRLVGHADRQYEVSFDLTYSARPWATSPSGRGAVTGRAGYLWHAHWIARRGYFRLSDLWLDYLQPISSVICLVSSDSPFELEISFPAVDDGGAIADAIGACFDGVLTTLLRQGDPDPLIHSWAEINADLDPRVEVMTPWSIVERGVAFASVFGA